MAPRTRTKSQPDTTVGGVSTGEFVCPECGKSFSRAAALGSHRKRAHGVAGSSKTPATARSSRRRSSSRGRTTAARAQTGTTTRARGRGRSSAPTNGQINRDTLLRTIFPNGVPPREDVIRAANDWLSEADRLARLK